MCSLPRPGHKQTYPDPVLYAAANNPVVVCGLESNGQGKIGETSTKLQRDHNNHKPGANDKKKRKKMNVTKIRKAKARKVSINSIIYR